MCQYEIPSIEKVFFIQHFVITCVRVCREDISQPYFIYGMLLGYTNKVNQAIVKIRTFYVKHKNGNTKRKGFVCCEVFIF